MTILRFHPRGNSTRGIRDSKLPSNRKIQVSNLPSLFLLFAVLAGASCAKIGEPRPPEVRIPKEAADLAARQSADSIVLTVSKPERNTNGSEATTLQSVDVFRLTEAAGAEDTAKPLPAEQVMKTATRILSIPSSRFPDYLNDKTFIIRDRPFSGGSELYLHTYRYAVLFINRKNQSAGFSNQALITPVPIPCPPTGLAAKGSLNSIKLSWTAPSENMDGSRPPRIAGYNIYRSEQSSKTPPALLNQDPIQGLEFEDLNFRFDTTYLYAVSIVGSLKNPAAESLPSETISFVSRDVFPPDPPKNFDAILQEDTVVLFWEPSPSSDVAGYRLYRLEKGTGVRQKVQPELIQTLSFRDSQIDPAL